MFHRGDAEYAENAQRKDLLKVVCCKGAEDPPMAERNAKIVYCRK